MGKTMQIYHGSFEAFSLTMVHEVWVGVVIISPEKPTKINSLLGNDPI